MTDDTQRLLGKISGQLDSLIDTVEDLDGRLTTRINDHSQRIRRIERSISWAVGGVTAIGGSISAAWAYFKHTGSSS